jgi:hypothetical protein
MNPGWPQTNTQRSLGALSTQIRNAALMENVVQSPSHYVWEVAGKPFTIHVDFDVIDRLSMEVMRGFGAVPRRGAEVGGVLLGTIELSGKLTVRIEDFEMVPCDYKRGPSFLLTDGDTQRLADAVARNAASPDRRFYVVGYFRSHTRDGLGLTEEDVKVFQTHFGDPSHVMLLVRPFATKSSVGAFFFEEDGVFRKESSYLEFPFRRRELGGGNTPSARANAAPLEDAIDAAPAEREIETLPEPANPSRGDEGDLREWVKRKGDRRQGPQGSGPSQDGASPAGRGFKGKWVWIPLSFIFLLLGIILGFQAALTLNRGDSEQLAVKSLMLSLSAQKDADGVVIRWDRRSAAVQHARSGLLQIQDGDFKKTVPLDARQLKNGSVIYRSTESTVSFRFEVLTQEGGTVSESVEYNPGVIPR